MSFDIRLLPEADAPTFDHVAEGGFDEPVHPERLAACLREPGHFFVAAIEDGMIVGQCAAVILRHPDKSSEFYIDEVGVADAWLRRGIAKWW